MSEPCHERQGPRTGERPRRVLIVNADDFGRSPGINAGVIEAHERGIVTSASMMVRWPAAEEAAAYTRGRPALGVGLHLDLGEWRRSAEGWSPVYERATPLDREAMEEEMRGQLERFRLLVGCDPTHLDSHQHVHSGEPAAPVARRLAGELGVPLRGSSPEVRYCGDFYGQTGSGEPAPEAIAVERLVELIAALPEGATELGCHPGFQVENVTTYRGERARELAALCDPRAREAIEREGIALRSFGGLVTRSPLLR